MVDLPLEIKVSSHLLRCGKQVRLVIDDTQDKSDPDPRLVGEILRARRWFDALSSGEVPTISELARMEDVSASYISLKISLAFHASDIVETIIDGTQPVSLIPAALSPAQDRNDLRFREPALLHPNLLVQDTEKILPPNPLQKRVDYRQN